MLDFLRAYATRNGHPAQDLRTCFSSVGCPERLGPATRDARRSLIPRVTGRQRATLPALSHAHRFQRTRRSTPAHIPVPNVEKALRRFRSPEQEITGVRPDAL